MRRNKLKKQEGFLRQGPQGFRLAALCFGVGLLPLVAMPAAGANLLLLPEYLQQVVDKNDSYRSAQRALEAARLQVHEGDVLTAPSAFATLKHSDDHQAGTIYTVDDTIMDVYDFGVSQQTSFGLSGKLHYSMTNLRYNQLAFGPGVTSNVNAALGQPVLELTLPIWRNWAGAETQSQVAAGNSQNEAKLHLQNFALKQLQVQAESAYWVLNLSRQSVKVALDSVQRAKTLVGWNQAKTKVGLADDAEYLQAEAAFQARMVDLQNSQNDLNSASRNFNSLRGLQSDLVPEDLKDLDLQEVRSLKVPVRVGDREDVQAAFAQSVAVRAGAELSKQKYLPTVEVFGLAATNNPVASNTSTVWGDSFNTGRPTTSIGLRLIAPLDFGTVKDLRQGYARDQMAADLDLQRKKLDQEVAWRDLQDRYQQHIKMLDLYEKLEKSQAVKLEYERARRSKGRTTTQQVLNFELEYEQVQFNRIRVMSELLQILSQMKLYGGEA